MASSKFLLYMFREDHERIRRWVLRYPDLETGGSLFGLWTSGRNAVAHVVLGPGRDSRRTGVSFFQDISYLGRVGNLLTHDYMLCHIGEWHSHHRLRLYEPSSGDVSTVVRNYPEGVCGFVLMIANIISEKDVSLSPYLFTEQSRSRHFGARYEPGEVIFLDGESPFRNLEKINESLNDGKEIFTGLPASSTGSYGFGRVPVQSHEVHPDSRRVMQKPEQEQRRVHITQREIPINNVNNDQLLEKQHQEDKQQNEEEPMDVCEVSGNENYKRKEEESKETELNQHTNREEERSTPLSKTSPNTSESTPLKTRVVVEGKSFGLDASLHGPEKERMANTTREEKSFAISATGSASHQPNMNSDTYQDKNKSTSVGDSRSAEQKSFLQREGFDPRGNPHPTAAEQRHTNPITTRTMIYPPDVANSKYQTNEITAPSRSAEKGAVLQLAGFEPQGSSHATAIGAPEKVFTNPTAVGSAGDPPNVEGVKNQGNESVVFSRSTIPQRAGLGPLGGIPSTAGTHGHPCAAATATGPTAYQRNMSSAQYNDERTIIRRSAEQDRSFQPGGLDPLGSTPSTVTGAPEQMYTKPNQWYSSAKGQQDLKTIQQLLSNIADGEVGMMRDLATHDLTISFWHHGKMWIIEFSPNFPYSGTKLKQQKYSSYTQKYFNETVKVISNCIISGVVNEVKNAVKLNCNKCSTHGALANWSRY